MSTAATRPRENRTITVDCRDAATSFQRLGAGTALVACVCAFLLALGFPLLHQATCDGGGGLPRHAHSARVRLGGVTIWRRQGTPCTAVCTVLPHFLLRDRQRRPEVAREALWATHGGRRWALCAVLSHLSPRTLSRLLGALGHQSLVPVLPRGGWPLPVSVLADAKHRRARTAQVSLPPPGLWSGPRALRRHRSRPYDGVYPVIPSVAPGGAPAGAVRAGPRPPARGLCQHAEPAADAVPWGTPRPLSPPRAPDAARPPGGDRVAWAPGRALPVPPPARPGPPAPGLAGVGAGPKGAALCRPRRHHGGSGPWRTGAALGAGEAGGRVGGPCSPPEARDQPAAGPGPDRPRTAAVRQARLPSSGGEPTGVADGARTLVPSHPVSASRAACGAVWRGSGRRDSPHTRLVSPPADPHLRRLALSGGTLHHVIRWNVAMPGDLSPRETQWCCACPHQDTTIPAWIIPTSGRDRHG
jgi:hypothetical protein